MFWLLLLRNKLPQHSGLKQPHFYSISQTLWVRIGAGLGWVIVLVPVVSVKITQLMDGLVQSVQDSVNLVWHLAGRGQLEGRAPLGLLQWGGPVCDLPSMAVLR